MSEAAAGITARPRLPLGAGAAFVLAILFLAGTIHISTILLMPRFARSDVFSRLATVAKEDAFAEIRASGPDAADVAGLDALFVNAACRIGLGESPAGIGVEARDRFWSLALLDRRGVVVFSLNDRTATDGRLDMVIVNAAQNAQIMSAAPASIAESIVVESPADDLIALLRLYAPNEASRRDARRILAQTECLPAPSILPGN